MTDEIIIGSRESKLAVIQSEIVREYIEQNSPNLRVNILTMKTTGDKILDRTLEQIGGKGLFVKELDRALIDGKTNLSVHSLKDMPMEVPDELPLWGFSKREDPRDVLVLPEGQEKPDFSKPIGCSSRRRIIQAEKLFPQAKFDSVRGNLQTRLRKLDEGQYGALLLAAAGLKRLGLEKRISRYFSTEEILPSAGQGILAIQGRKNENYEYVKGFFNEEAAYMATAERAFVRTLDGGCSSPIAAYAAVCGSKIRLTGLYYEEKSKTYSKKTMSGPAREAEVLGITLAEEMRRAYI